MKHVLIASLILKCLAHELIMWNCKSLFLKILHLCILVFYFLELTLIFSHSYFYSFKYLYTILSDTFWFVAMGLWNTKLLSIFRFELKLKPKQCINGWRKWQLKENAKISWVYYYLMQMATTKDLMATGSLDIVLTKQFQIFLLLSQ